MRIITACILLLAAAAASGQTVSGRISADETWAGTVTLTGDVEILNATLTISPGTIVQFDTVSDNRINGSTNSICLIIKSGGAINAAGTAAQPVLFTTLSPSKSYGRWSQLDIMEGINAAQTAFRHCTFEACATGIDFRSSDHDVIRAVSAITVEECTFRTISGSGIYITSGGSPTITRCRFDDCRSTAIFGHGAGTVAVEYCTITDASVAIINAGEPTWGWEQTMNIDHLTVSNIRGEKAAIAKWWTGMGVYCSGAANQTGTISLTNSIIADVVWPGNYTVGFMIGSWTATNDYNCWYEAGSTEISGGDIGSHAVEADPQFADVSDPALGLAAGSPCLNTGSDGEHIGAWQGTPVAAVPMPGNTAGVSGIRVPNPVHDRAVFEFENSAADDVRLEIYTPDGCPVARLTAGAGARSIVWERRAENSAGVYPYRLIAGTAQSQGLLIAE